MKWKGKMLMVAGMAFLATAGIGLSRSVEAGQCGMGSGPKDAGARAKKDCPMHGMDEDIASALKTLESVRKALDDDDVVKASEGVDAAIERFTALREKMAGGCPMKGEGVPVNTRCPIMGSNIDPDDVPGELKRSFKGETVGFCCPGCLKTWDALSDEEKASRLKESR